MPGGLGRGVTGGLVRGVTGGLVRGVSRSFQSVRPYVNSQMRLGPVQSNVNLYVNSQMPLGPVRPNVNPQMLVESVQPNVNPQSLGSIVMQHVNPQIPLGPVQNAGVPDINLLKGISKNVNGTADTNDKIKTDSDGQSGNQSVPPRRDYSNNAANSLENEEYQNNNNNSNDTLQLEGKILSWGQGFPLKGNKSSSLSQSRRYMSTYTAKDGSDSKSESKTILHDKITDNRATATNNQEGNGTTVTNNPKGNGTTNTNNPKGNRATATSNQKGKGTTNTNNQEKDPNNQKTNQTNQKKDPNDKEKDPNDKETNSKWPDWQSIKKGAKKLFKFVGTPIGIAYNINESKQKEYIDIFHKSLEHERGIILREIEYNKKSRSPDAKQKEELYYKLGENLAALEVINTNRNRTLELRKTLLRVQNSMGKSQFITAETITSGGCKPKLITQYTDMLKGVKEDELVNKIKEYTKEGATTEASPIGQGIAECMQYVYDTFNVYDRQKKKYEEIAVSSSTKKRNIKLQEIKNIKERQEENCNNTCQKLIDVTDRLGTNIGYLSKIKNKNNDLNDKIKVTLDEVKKDDLEINEAIIHRNSLIYEWNKVKKCQNSLKNSN